MCNFNPSLKPLTPAFHGRVLQALGGALGGIPEPNQVIHFEINPLGDHDWSVTGYLFHPGPPKWSLGCARHYFRLPLKTVIP